MSWIDPAAEPDFPPLFSGRRVVPGTSALEGAVAGAATGELTAGDVIWESDPARVALAVVLEPDVTLRQAAQMLPLTMVALADCIGSLAPPQVGVMFRWPGTVTVNGARVGEVRVVAPGAAPDAVPDWLVVAVDVGMQLGADEAEPGTSPDRTTLAEEGCAELTYIDVMGSFSKHLLTWINIWEDEGFKPVHKSWMERVEEQSQYQSQSVAVKGMDEDGNLIVGVADGSVRLLALVDTIETIGAADRSGDQEGAG
mgnify:CR=1 FL=1